MYKSVGVQHVTQEMESLSTRAKSDANERHSRPPCERKSKPITITPPNPYYWESDFYGMFISYDQIREFVVDVYPELHDLTDPYRVARTAVIVLRTWTGYEKMNWQYVEVTPELKAEFPEITEEVGEEFRVLCLAHFLGYRPQKHQVKEISSIFGGLEARWWHSPMLLY